MKRNKISLSFNIWIYFVGFALLVFVLLFLAQTVFLKPYYRYSKTKELDNIANYITEFEDETNFEEMLDFVASETEVCIEVVENSQIIYSTSSMFRSCNMSWGGSKSEIQIFKSDFISGEKMTDTFTTEEHEENGQALIYAIKYDEDTNVFLNTSLIPIGTTSNIMTTLL